MLYLAIDQHAKQLTVNLRDEQGTVLLRRQVSTQPARVREFFAELREQATTAGGYLAILEVCGFNDWLLALLSEYGCRETVLVQCKTRSKHKTDRRDANQLGELLWVNRLRLETGEKLHHLRRIVPPTREDAVARQLTSLRKSLGTQRTRVINRCASILRKHNLQHACPTQGFQTKAARKWLTELTVTAIDRLELNQLLARWELLERQLAEVNEQVSVLRETHPTAALVSTVPGLNGYSGLAIACRIGDIERFSKPASLANYFGLTPSSHNSGESGQRLGSITKQGSTLVRFLLGQAVLHVLRRDPVMRAWYQGIKRRRGSKIARVAVMRRIVTALWHMLKQGEPYRSGGSSGRQAARQRDQQPPSKAALVGTETRAACSGGACGGDESPLPHAPSTLFSVVPGR